MNIPLRQVIIAINNHDNNDNNFINSDTVNTPVIVILRS